MVWEIQDRTRANSAVGLSLHQLKRVRVGKGEHEGKNGMVLYWTLGLEEEKQRDRVIARCQMLLQNS